MECRSVAGNPPRPKEPAGDAGKPGNVINFQVTVVDGEKVSRADKFDAYEFEPKRFHVAFEASQNYIGNPPTSGFIRRGRHDGKWPKAIDVKASCGSSVGV